MNATTISSVATLDSGKKTHILVFPYPAQGHLLPFLDLTNQLAMHGLEITILVTPKNLPILQPVLTAHPNTIRTLILPFPTHPKLPSGVENIKDIGDHGNLPMVAALSKLQVEIIQWFKSQSHPPQAIISDFFLGWTHQLANQLNIPRFVFFSSGSFLTSISYNLWQNMYSLTSEKIFYFPNLPKTPSFTEEHLPSMFRILNRISPGADVDIVKESVFANYKSWGCIFNTFHSLEGEYLDYMQRAFGHERVYGVGPLSLIGRSNSSIQTNSNSGTRDSVLRWLDECPHESVLYVCFGSQTLLSAAQMQALALGLEQSNTRFLLVVKSATTEQLAEGQGKVPGLFEKRIAGRGLVIQGWAPQAEILNHKAVAGFLSHCGWNSVLESIVAGVMILAWPMGADQFVNAKLLVEDIGMAVHLCEGADTVPNPNELAEIIGSSLGKNVSLKERAKLMKGKALDAVEGNGSSSTHLKELMSTLRDNQIHKFHFI